MAVGYDSPERCDVGACVQNTCADEGCDGPEDCPAPAAPVCRMGACSSGMTACESAGGRIVFVSNRDGDEDILTMHADGTAVSAITLNGVSDRSPSWSPSGEAVAFRRQTQGGAYDVFVMDSDGTNASNVTQNPESQDHFAWSRSGTSLAFATGTVDEFVSYVINLDGSALSPLGGRSFSARPSFSPDGTKVAYWAYDTQSTGGIFAIAADGSAGLAMLGPVAAPIRALSWSPDGSQLAYVEGVAGAGDIWTRDASGANPRNLTMTADDETDVVWSPDGTTLVFVRAGEIWSVLPDGTGPANLTKNAAFDDGPVFSADGAHIFFTSDRDGNREVYRMGRDGSNPVNLTRHPANDDQPDWAGCPAQ